MLDVKHWEMHIFEKKCIMHLGKNALISEIQAGFALENALNFRIHI